MRGRRGVERGRRAFGAAAGQVPKKGKLSVKCRRRAKGDFVAREGQRGERGRDERKEEEKRSGGAVWRRSREEERSSNRVEKKKKKEEGPSFTHEKSTAEVGPDLTVVVSEEVGGKRPALPRMIAMGSETRARPPTCEQRTRAGRQEKE